MQEIKVTKNGTELTIKELTKKEYKKFASKTIQSQLEIAISDSKCDEETAEKIRTICNGDKYLSTMASALRTNHLTGKLLGESSRLAFKSAWNSLIIGVVLEEE